MEKERGFKIIAIVALVVSIVGISVGFAAYTRNLTISSFDATVKAQTNPFEPTTGQETTTGLILANAATTTSTTVKNAGTASNATWSGIVVQFDKDNRTASLTADVKNFSDYTAYLKSITIADAWVCAAVTPAATNSALVTALCNAVSMSVSVGTGSNKPAATYDADAASPATPITNYTSQSGVTAGDVAAASGSTAGTNTITLTLSIDSNVTLPDGDVVITVPTITFGYSSLANS